VRFRGRAQSHDAQDAAHRHRQDGEAEPCRLQQPATVWRRLCVVVRRGPYISFPERDRIVELAFKKGVLFLGCGPSTIRLCPALVVTKEEADVALDVLEECLKLVGA